MSILFQLLSLVLKVAEVLLIIRIVLSWVMPYGKNEFSQTIYSLTEPILAPLRVMIPVGNIRFDLAPIAAFFIIGLLRNLLFRLFF